MTLSPTTLQQLHDLVQQDTSLQHQVQGVHDAATAATLIAQAAMAKGLAVDAGDLACHFQEAASAASLHSLSDAQLEAVAGGWSKQDSMILVSVLTFGVGCAMTSIIQGAQRQACVDGFKDQPGLPADGRF